MFLPVFNAFKVITSYPSAGEEVSVYRDHMTSIDHSVISLVVNKSAVFCKILAPSVFSEHYEEVCLFRKQMQQVFLRCNMEVFHDAKQPRIRAGEIR